MAILHFSSCQFKQGFCNFRVKLLVFSKFVGGREKGMLIGGGLSALFNGDEGLASVIFLTILMRLIGRSLGLTLKIVHIS
jgi:hypothetical protein